MIQDRSTQDFIKFARGSKASLLPDGSYSSNTWEQTINGVNAGLVPVVVERSARGERSFDIFSRLLRDRIVLLGTPVNDQIANIKVAELLFLTSEDPDKDINFYINSPGGSVYAGMAIYDTMQYVRPNVATICVGLAASMGSFLLTAGHPGKRSSLPNSRIMIHQPSSGAQGQASDIEIAAKEILWIKQHLNGLLAHHTGQPIEVIERDTDRDNFMSPQEAKDYGMIDIVLEAATGAPQKSEGSDL